MGKKHLFFSILILFVCLTFSNANAQLISALTGAASADTAPTTPELKEDILNRQTPKGLVDGFLQAVRNENYTRAALFLDLEEFPKNLKEKKGEELSNGLQKLLDQHGSVIASSRLSIEANGHQNDGLPLNLDIVGSIRVGQETIDIFAERFPHEKYGHIWLISKKTVDKIPEALNKLSLGYLDRFLPDILIKTKRGN